MPNFNTFSIQPDKILDFRPEVRTGDKESKCRCSVCNKRIRTKYCLFTWVGRHKIRYSDVCLPCVPGLLAAYQQHLTLTLAKIGEFRLTIALE